MHLKRNKTKTLADAKRSELIYDLYNSCTKCPTSWAECPEVSLNRSQMKFIGSLRKIAIPSDHIPSQGIPEAAKGLSKFIAVTSEGDYYVDTGNNNYCRYVFKILNSDKLIQYYVKIGEVVWNPLHGRMSVEKTSKYRSALDGTEGVLYYCKKMKK